MSAERLNVDACVFYVFVFHKIIMVIAFFSEGEEWSVEWYFCNQ